MSNIWKIKNKEDFYSSIIFLPEAEVKEAIDQNNKDKYYKNSYKADKSLGQRLIYNIEKDNVLYMIQRNIKKNLLENIALSDCCFGFRKNHSYYDFLDYHSSFYGYEYFLRLDIQGFFESITVANLNRTFKYYFVEQSERDNSEEEILKEFINIITYNNHVPTGAITSPLVSNIYFRELDIRIEKYCKKLKVNYSRYADDLLFSSDNKYLHDKRFISMMSQIMHSKDLKINYDKILRCTGQLSLNGYVVDQEIKLSRKKLKSISRILFFVERKILKKEWQNIKKDYKSLNRMLASQNDKHRFDKSEQLVNYLTGYRAFLIQVLQKSKATETIDKYSGYIKRIENVVLQLV